MKEDHPMPTAQANVKVATEVARQCIEALSPWVDRIEIAGSIRRRKPYVKDIEIVAIPSLVSDGLFGDPVPATAEIRAVCEKVGHVLKGGEKYIQAADVFGSGMTMDLFLVTPPAEWGTILAIRTGPAGYSQEAVTRIKGRLWRCQQGWVRNERGERVPTPEEADFFAAARMPYLSPEERANP
jgi:DNA polymerase/3'-5' exonuclease PolX